MGQHRNTTSTQYFLYQVHHHPYLHHLTWESILFSVVDSSHHSVWGTEILEGHANRHLAYPPQTDDILISIYRHLFTSTAHVICRAPRSHHFWHNTLMMMMVEVRCVMVVATPYSPWDVPAITQPQGATEEFSDTLSPTREQMTPHTGAINKKRDHSFFQMLIPLVATFVCQTQHDNTTCWISTAIHSSTTMTAHHHADIPDDLLSSTRCLFTCKWLTAFKPNKQASCERPFLHEKKYPQGGLWRHKHQTPIKHTSTEANRLKYFPKASYIYGLWCSVLPLSLPLHFSPLCAVLVLFLRYFIYPFFFFFCTGP